MASLMTLLLETMPFAGVANTLRHACGKDWEDLGLDEVATRVTLLPNDGPIDIELPALNSAAETSRQPLWAFKQGPDEPAAVEGVYCRVRDADYVGHRVAKKIAWGLEETPGSFKPEVRVTFGAGAEISFPLTRDFIFYKFLLRGGRIADDQTRLWRLQSELDTSLVVVFAYDIDPVTGEVRLLDLDTISDPTLRDDAKEADRAVRELLGTSDGTGGAHGSGPGENPPEEPPLDNPEEPDRLPPKQPDPEQIGPPPPEPWGTKALKGDFWRTTSESGTSGNPPVMLGPGGEVGSTVNLSTEPGRVLIVFTFTTCCERADFEPGAIVGFAKCFPHLLVSSTIGVARIEASVRIDRPHTLEKWNEAERDMGASCCRPGYDGWTPELKSLLVCDTNVAGNIDLGGVLPPLPTWSNMFDYYLLDPNRTAPGTKFHVVRTDRPTRRESDRPLVQRRVIMGYDSPPFDGFPIADKSIVRKWPRQGEFDNVHMAPRLKLLNVTAMRSKLLDSNPRFFRITDRAEWRLDDIAMAPFCAHDCLHLHWRWSDFATTKWTRGWDANGPYAADGAPMVPQSQDVWIFFRADAALTYHVVDTAPSFVAGWCPFLHHGFGYAVAIQDKMKTASAMVAVDTFGTDFVFLDKEGRTVSLSDSTAAYYWWARNDVEVYSNEPFVFDRLSWKSEADLAEARKL